MALIFSTLAVVLLSGFLGALFVQSVSETVLEHRDADATSALWLAESGIAKVKSMTTLPVTTTTGSIPNTTFPSNTYTFSVAVPTSIGSGCYTLVSTGTVTSPGSVITRAVSATLHIIPPDASQIIYSVETTSPDLTFKNKCLKNLENPADLYKTSSQKTFQSFFGVPMATMLAKSKQAGNLYAQDTSLGNTITAQGVTWIDVSPGQTLSIQHLNNLSSSSIVIINGNFKLNGVAGGGGSTFKGILYVIGTFEMLGNATVEGTAFIESSAQIGADLTGSSLVSYNSANIAESLSPLSTKAIVSWKEN